MKIVFFGDSVTEGVFELINKSEGGFDSVFDKEHVYHKVLMDKLKKTYPEIVFESVNAGIAGNSSKDGLDRIESVLKEKADLVVVCFGLNDAWLRKPDEYAENMNKIFQKIKGNWTNCIFMTPNMMNTYLVEGTLPVLYDTAKDCAILQNSGIFDDLLEKAKKVAKANGVVIADAYAFWKRLASYGIDTTKLLANKINHPTREMHRAFADILFETIVGNNLLK